VRALLCCRIPTQESMAWVTENGMGRAFALGGKQDPQHERSSVDAVSLNPTPFLFLVWIESFH